MDHRAFPISFKAASQTDGVPEGIAELIVSVFGNVDGGNEIVEPGFFKESLLSRRTPDGRPRIKGAWGHDWNIPVAKTLDAAELAPGDARLPEDIRGLGGLWVKAAFNLDTQRGKEAFSDLRFGTVDELSIGYSVEADHYDSAGVRHLDKGIGFEWSPVLAGMNDKTAVLSVKAAKAGNSDNLVCPYCSPKADPGSEDAADCSCGSDCGEGECPSGSKSAKDMPMGGTANPFAYPLLASYEDLQDDLTEAAQSMLPAWAMTDLAGLLGDADDLQAACVCLVATLPAEAIFFICPDPWNDPDDGLYVRVPYTVDARSGEPQIGTPTLVQPAFVPVNTAQIVEGASRIARGAQGVAQKARETARRTKEGRMLSGTNRSALQEALSALTQAAASVQALLDASAPADTSSDDDMKAWAESSRILARTLGAPV